MNLGSIMLYSGLTSSKAVFNQVALTVDSRRSVLDDNRAAALRLSAATVKIEREKLTKPTASITSLA